MKSRCIKIGLLVLIIAYLTFTVLGYLKAGSTVFQTEDILLLLFISFLFGFTGYGTAKYFYTQKELYFPFQTNVKKIDDAEKIKLWKLHRKYMFSRLFFTIAKIFAIVTPGYILAYLDESELLKSGIGIIIGLALIALISFLLGKKFQKEFQTGNL